MTMSAFPTIGVVNYQLLASQHPDSAKAWETMQAAMAQVKNDFEAKTANMDENEKMALYQRIQQGIQQKQQDLLKDIADKIDVITKAVAVAKGLTMVVHKGAVVFGGLDITDEVLKEITGK